MIEIKRKIPRKLRVWRPWLSAANVPCGHCDACMQRFEAQIEAERPGHVWTVKDGKVVYLEDELAASMLGRPLNKDEIVIHKDGNFTNNSRANLEIVTLPDMER